MPAVKKHTITPYGELNEIFSPIGKPKRGRKSLRHSTPNTTNVTTVTNLLNPPARKSKFDRIERCLKISLSLAKIIALNAENSISYGSKKFNIEEFLKFLDNSLTARKRNNSVDKYIELLAAARVDPDLIVNENIKHSLKSIYSLKPKSTLPEFVDYKRVKSKIPRPILKKSNTKRTPLKEVTFSKTLSWDPAGNL